MHIPPAPKAPNRKPCGKCEGCNREFGYQPCKSAPNPSKPIGSENEFINNSSSDFAAVCFLVLFSFLFGSALFLAGFVFGLSISEVK